MTPLQRRIVDLSYKHRLTHISSCLNTVGTLDTIYQMRAPDEPVCLGNSHAACALYVVLEKHGLCDAEEMIAKHGTHAGRDPEHGIWVSGGSLGQVETVAIGMALANRGRRVWLVTSDGACAEGSVWEAFHIAWDNRLDNLRVFVIANGYGGYREINLNTLHQRLQLALRTFRWVEPDPLYFPFLQGLDGHYAVLTEAQYNEMMR